MTKAEKEKRFTRLLFTRNLILLARSAEATANFTVLDQFIKECVMPFYQDGILNLREQEFWFETISDMEVEA